MSKFKKKFFAMVITFWDPNVRAFKEEITQYCGTKYAIGVASGMDAFE